MTAADRIDARRRECRRLVGVTMRGARNARAIRDRELARWFVELARGYSREAVRLRQAVAP